MIWVFHFLNFYKMAENRTNACNVFFCTTLVPCFATSKFVSNAEQVSISSTFYVQIFRTNVILAAFSSNILTLAKNSYKKWAHIMLMKLTTGDIMHVWTFVLLKFYTCVRGQSDVLNFGQVHVSIMLDKCSSVLLNWSGPAQQTNINIKHNIFFKNVCWNSSQFKNTVTKLSWYILISSYVGKTSLEEELSDLSVDYSWKQILNVKLT